MIPEAISRRVGEQRKLARSAGIAFALVFIMALNAHASSNSELKEQIQKIAVNYKPIESLPPGFFIRVEQETDNTWDVKESSRTRLNGRTNDRQEIIYVSRDLTYAQPCYDKIRYQSRGKHQTTFECSPIIDDNKSYTPCVSSLTSTMGVASAIKSFVAIVTTLGVAAGTHKYVDEEKVKNVLRQDRALLAISKFLEEDSCVDMLRKDALSLPRTGGL
jgi:hypothetical protein